jgi:hypothetical protein
VSIGACDFLRTRFMIPALTNEPKDRLRPATEGGRPSAAVELERRLAAREAAGWDNGPDHRGGRGERIDGATGRMRQQTVSGGGVHSGVSRSSAAAREGAVSWLDRLAVHVATQRRRSPGDQLAVFIDVDGSLLDLRPGLAARLSEWDAAHGTQHFAGLLAADIVPGEAGLRRLFEARGLSYAVRDELLGVCHRYAWSPDAVIGAHEPCLGMLEVLRWMQTQPGVAVVLNSSRCELRRDETLQALRTLCRHYHMRLDETRLHLSPYGERSGVRAKTMGVQHFRKLGLVPVAVVDDDAEEVRAIEKVLGDPNVLCLVVEPFARVDNRASSRPVTPIWSGLESASDFELFGAANVGWADVALERSSCGHLATRPARGVAVDLEDILGPFAQLSRGVRMTFDDPSAAVRAMGVVEKFRFPWRQVAVRLLDHQLDDAWFAALAPYRAELDVAIDGGFLLPALPLAPELVAQTLVRLAERGVTRVCVPADGARLCEFEPLVRAVGCALELCAGARPSDYVAAVLAGPDSVSCNFDRASTRDSERTTVVVTRRLGALTV